MPNQLLKNQLANLKCQPIFAGATCSFSGLVAPSNKILKYLKFWKKLNYLSYKLFTKYGKKYPSQRTQYNLVYKKNTVNNKQKKVPFNFSITVNALSVYFKALSIKPVCIECITVTWKYNRVLHHLTVEIDR